jgi:uncharacterized protein involved in exopolysaccharide biosynthesis/Mrp family chromosome partitioning ATPase
MVNQPEDAFALSDSDDEPGLLSHAQRALRGRYRLTACLALLAALAGASLGWHREAPLYQSNGMIRITPLMQRILYSSQTEKNAPPPAPGIFEAFVQSQVSIIRSQQIIDIVMQSEDWKATGEGNDERAVARFWSRLDVHHPPRTELIRVSFSHSDPEVATQAVRLAIRAYRAIQDRQSAEQRIQALLGTDAELAEKLEGIREQIAEIASRHGTTDLTRLFNMQMMALAELESAYRGNRLDLIFAESSVVDPDGASEPTVDEIASFDPLMLSYIEKKDALETELEIWKERYTAKMPGRDRLEIEHRELGKKIEKRRTQISGLSHLPAAPKGSTTAPMNPQAIETLRKREDRVRKLYEEARKVTLQIGMDDLRVQTLRSEADLVQSRLEEIRGRIQQLRVESSVIGRINVISAGDRPLVPIADKRQLMAGLGGMGGIVLVIGIVIAWGLADRRLRYSDEVVWRTGIPLLGVVPEIEPEAAHGCATDAVVRDLRWTLELRSHRESHKLQTIAVAGGMTAAGTSSVALAMAISFARTGTSTALVDLRSDPRRLRELLAPGSGNPSMDPSVPEEVETGIRNLKLIDALSLGPATELPSRAIQNLFQEVRSRFEVVLVDCGSLGDIEGVLPACAMADGSILVCARGSDASALRAAAERLRASDACLLGTIFNRAAPDDTPGHTRRGTDEVARIVDERFRHLGPLAATVMQSRSAEA